MTVDSDALERFLDRQAIQDVVTRYCRAVDRVDMDLLRTCYHPGAILRGRVVPLDFESFTLTREKFTGTLHFVTNHSSQIEGDRAVAETYVLAHHWGEPAEDPAVNFTSGARYVDLFERRGDAGWRIVERYIIRELTTTLSVESPDGAQPTVTGTGEQAPVSRRDGSDLSYLVPSTHGFRALGMPQQP
jgi:hypothetical protein